MEMKKMLEILLVEDDPGDVELVRESLREADRRIKLHVMEDGVKALQFLRKRNFPETTGLPDIILLDLNLPKMRGLEVLREIRNEAQFKDIPVVVLTSSALSEDISDCYRAGADRYVTKPLEFDGGKQVVAVIDEILLRRSLSRRWKAIGGEERKSLKILLVEDDPGDALMIREYLEEKSGPSHHLVRVERLVSALDLITSEAFDAVLLDLGLPDSHGLEGFRQVQAAAPKIPVVILTGFDDEEYAREAVQKGAQDYLVKGRMQGGLLIRSIHYAIERQKLYSQLEQSLLEIKTLRGILPICANCKKIRDDKGYWIQLETYLSRHTEADFSHGLCEGCMDKLYSDYQD